jgi:predicted permease
MLRDLRLSVRSLASAPGVTAISVMCVALGIGANTAIFSLLDAALLRPLPVPNPDQLVVAQFVDAEGRGGSSFSYPLFSALREHGTDAVDLFAYARFDLNLSADALIDSPSGLAVSDRYFTALRVRPALGRLITSPDEPVVVLSYRYWHTRFHSSNAVIGRTLLINGIPLTVAGIAPHGFFGTDVGAARDVFVPLALRDRLSAGAPRLPMPNSFWLRVMGRLAPGVTQQQADARLEAVYRKYAGEIGGAVSPGLRRLLQSRRIVTAPGARGPLSVQAAPARSGPSGVGGQFATPLRILMAAAVVVLLIACANVAALLLARGIARRREIAIKLALGAGRARLMRQLLIESMLVSVVGAGLGLAVGLWTAGALRTFLTDRVPEVTLDARLLGFTLLATAFTTLVFGVVPAIRAAHSDLAPSLKPGTSFTSSGRRLGWLLVPGQVALSLLLLFGAGLFLRTLANLRTMDPGFRGDHVLVATTNPGLSQYSEERITAFYGELVDRVSALPGVSAAAIADAPLLSSIYLDSLSIDGSNQSAEASARIAGPRFFETMGIRLLAGRDFSNTDTRGSPKVAIINETIARNYFAGESALGKRIGLGTDPDMEVIGVIADTKYRDLRQPIPNTVYVPLQQARFLGTERTLHVRTGGDPRGMIAAVRDQIRALDASLPARIRPFTEVIDTTLERERLTALLSGCFAALALVLAAVGLYGVLSNAVQRRTREIGIRVSLGARPSRVLWMVLRDCLVVVAVGIAAGAPVCFWLSGLVKAQLFAVSPYDPGTAVGSVCVLTLIAGLAGYIPARRASRVDPVIALRNE